MDHSNQHISKGNYTTFVLMLASSFVVMFITMYLNTYELDHVYFSLTRFYISCMGIATMAVIMWAFMRKMYQNKKKNRAILLGSLVLFTGALTLVRMQKPIIGDLLWMRAMIPHHSIAILTSERADIQDPEVRQLRMILSKHKRRKLRK